MQGEASNLSRRNSQAGWKLPLPHRQDDAHESQKIPVCDFIARYQQGTSSRKGMVCWSRQTSKHLHHQTLTSRGTRA